MKSNSNNIETGVLLCQEIPFELRKKLVSALLHMTFLFFALLLITSPVRKHGDFYGIKLIAITVRNLIIITIGIVAFVFLDWKIQHYITLQSLPIKVYEKGIDMPTTFIDKILRKTNFISFENIRKITIKSHGPYSWCIKFPHKKKGPKYFHELVILTKEGKKYASLERHPERLQPIIQVIKEKFKGPIYEEWENKKSLREEE